MTTPLHIQPPGFLLGSASPRRRALLREMGFHFKVRTAEVDEVYPKRLQGHEITDYLCRIKSDALQDALQPGTLLLTADTIVWHQDTVLDKPESLETAAAALRALSGKTHRVITSLCFRNSRETQIVHETTRVTFGKLEEHEILAYFERGNPLDKAGAYGIQEWIGMIGVERIEGSYTNVVGLPTRLVYKTLRAMAKRGF